MPLTLENRNGKIVAVDDQGNVQSIQLGDTVHDSVDTDHLFTDAQRVYARSNGSDANDGLTASDAKATILSAIEDAPVSGSDDYLIVDIQEPGATFTESVSLQPYHPTVKVLGPTDGSGNPDVTIDGSPVGYAFDQDQTSKLVVENAELTNVSVEHRVKSNSWCIYDNVVTGTGFTDRPVTVIKGGYFEARNGTLLDANGSDRNTVGSVGGDVELEDCTVQGATEYAVGIEDGGSLITRPNTVIDGESTSDGVRSQDNSHAKISDSTIQNCGVGLQVQRGGSADVSDNVTFSNVTTEVVTNNSGFAYDIRTSPATIYYSVLGDPEDVTASRSFNTTYTNDTKRDKRVSVVAKSNSAGTDIQLIGKITTPGGSTIQWANERDSRDSNRYMTVQMLVPAGHDYEVTAGGATTDYVLDSWAEMGISDSL